MPLLLLAAAGAAGTAGAQDVACDPGEPEVRSLAFEGNRAFASDELAVRIATTPSDPLRRTVRLLGTRRCLNRDELARDVLRLRVLYRARGYYETAVDTAVREVAPHAVAVHFRIVEGEPVRLDSLTITGLERIPDGARILEGVLPARGAPFDRGALGAAVDTITRRLRDNGYPYAEVLPGYEVLRDERRATADLTVLPGPRARIGALRFEVEPMPGKERELSDYAIRRLLGVSVGDLFRARDLEAAQRRLYQTNAFRNVQVSIAPDSGGRARDSLVTIAIRLREDFMRQIDTEWGWGTLDCFRTRVQYTDKNFLGGARRLELNGQLSKIGYGRPLGFAEGLCFSDIRRDPYSTEANYFVGATLRAPQLWSTRFVPAFSLFSERRGEFLAYLRTTHVGADAAITRELAPRVPFRLVYTFEFGRTEAQDAFLCAIFSRCTQEEQNRIRRSLPLATLGATVARSRVDVPLNPRQGTVQRLEFRSSSRFLGSDRTLQFTRGLADLSYYRPLGWGTVLAMRVRGGAVLNSGVRVGSSDGSYVPPQERLFAGGATSVRGFQQNELGALVYIAESYDTVQAAGDTVYFRARAGARPRRFVPAGGDAMLVANFEYRIRDPFLPELVQYTLFADAGEVWSRSDARDIIDFRGFREFRSLKWTPGLGVRVFSPVGPIQVNVAYNPYARPSGPLYFDAPASGAGGRAPLYCVTPGNQLPVVLRTLPSGETVAEQRRQGSGCPATFAPSSSRAFLRRLTFTFSIGPDF